MRRKEETAGLEARFHAVVHSNTPADAAAVVVVAVAVAAAAAAVAAAESEIVEDRQSRTGLSRAYETNETGRRERERAGAGGRASGRRRQQQLLNFGSACWIGLRLGHGPWPPGDCF